MIKHNDFDFTEPETGSHSLVHNRLVKGRR